MVNELSQLKDYLVEEMQRIAQEHEEIEKSLDRTRKQVDSLIMQNNRLEASFSSLNQVLIKLSEIDESSENAATEAEVGTHAIKEDE